MSEIKFISPMLDDFAVGDSISDHNGVRCYPAMKEGSDDKYIIKVISVPPTQSQLEALLLSGAYSDKDAALSYFKELADDIIQEATILSKLSASAGFLPIDASQIDKADDQDGYNIYLRSAYAVTLQRQLRHSSLTHLSALNLGLDICAALEAARHMGYLYINLKPSNIYLGSSNEYRIGDIGFLQIASLRFASLPERYRSEYTAPEVADAYSSLNTTIDIYALGLILYQIFNDGALPVKDENGAIPAPAYADYEITEIIMKACADDPAERWQNPAEFGQALITYMQRNGAYNTPITPVSDPQAIEEVAIEDEPTGAYIRVEEADATEDDITDDAEMEAAEANNDEAVTEIEEVPAVLSEEEIYTEDQEGNLTLIEDEADETMTEADSENIAYDEVTDEVSDILLQADDLIDHDAPGPVIQPEPIDVPMPAPITCEESDKTEEELETDSDEISAEEADAQQSDNAEDTDMEDAPLEDTTSDEELAADEAETDEAEEYYDEELNTEPKKSTAGKWIAGILITLLIAGLLAAGFFFVRDYFLQRIDSVTLTAGKPGELLVEIITAADEAELEIICTDTYGISQKAPVKDGTARFENLMPNSSYKISVETTGFHYLIGDTSASYVTPNTTEIIQLSAVTGPEDGSVILSFTISGPDSESWIVTYTKDDGIKESVVFSGHIVTINGLTPDKSYTFTLAPEEALDMIGQTTVEHTARTIIKAEQLVATSCIDGNLSVQWSVKNESQVSAWTVRCYNDDFDKTTSVTETEATFTVPDDRASYTVEVTASGMSVSERVVIPENSTTITDFTVTTENGEMCVTWSNIQEIPENGWILVYSADGSTVKQISCEENDFTITPVIPDCTYSFYLQTTDGETVLGSVQNYFTGNAEKFEGYSVSSDDMEFKMCLTPSNSNWDRYDLSKSDYTTTFEPNEEASFLVRLRRAYDTSKDNIESLFVIRDANGNIVSANTSTTTWSRMWYKNYCELDIPEIPEATGNYTIQVYFNRAFAYEGTFTVEE